MLPAYSLIEGLLCGNVNILKLPEADEGITVMLLKMLSDMEPAVKGYIHVFDTPSSDVAAMMKMAAMSDAISVWGGDAAIGSVRQLASPGTALIEWGHKLSFCYISGDFSGGFKDMESALLGLSENIISTKQLLCSSCQVIYLDTESMEDIYGFCEYFLPLLQKAAEGNAARDIGERAETALRQRVREIEAILDENTDPSVKVFAFAACTLAACTDMELELSDMFGNVLVKRLPRERMMDILRKKKGYLQTAGLIAGKGREELAQALIRCGVNRVLFPGDMSVSFLRESHDGVFPFQRMTRVVNIEKAGNS